jgi:uncharacterized membrane protein YdjX (TVP38/TMEM64 family)
MDNNNFNKKRKIIAIAKFAFLATIVIGIPTYLYFFHREFIVSFRSIDDVRDFILEHEMASILVYSGLQVLQIIVAIIPGQPFHVAAGFIFGFGFGYLIAIIGIIIGSTLTFYASRIFGKDAMRLFFGEERFNKFLNLANSKKGLVIIFLMYLIPGFPKDGLGYIVGFSKIKLLYFLAIAVVGRTPALMMSIAIGALYAGGSYIAIIIVVAIAIIFGIFAFIYRKKIMSKFDNKADQIKSNPE